MLTFDSIIHQGLPFFGGNIIYHLPLKTDEDELILRSAQYRGSLQTARLDNGREKNLIYPPYTANLGTVSAGLHTVDMMLYGNRYNAFGAIHLSDRKERWIGPNS